MATRKVPDVGDIKAFLGNGAEFEGLLCFDGTVRIDGLFKGEIQTNDCLIIGDTGKVEAEIQVGHLVVMGKLTGNVKAGHKVEIASTGHVHGDLISPILVIQEGAVLEGNIKMDSGAAEKEKVIKLKDIKEGTASGKAVAN